MKYCQIMLCILVFLFVSNFCYANNYVTTNDYEVEIYWKVKHRRKLIVWGSVRGCSNIVLRSELVASPLVGGLILALSFKFIHSHHEIHNC